MSDQSTNIIGSSSHNVNTTICYKRKKYIIGDLFTDTGNLDRQKQQIDKALSHPQQNSSKLQSDEENNKMQILN